MTIKEEENTQQKVGLQITIIPNHAGISFLFVK